MPRKRKPRSLPTGQPQGQRAENEAVQSSGQPQPTPGVGGQGGGDPLSLLAGTPPPTATPLNAPPADPTRPVTAGAPYGPGPGPSGTRTPPPPPELDAATIAMAKLLPAMELTSLVNPANANARQIARFYRSKLPPDYYRDQPQ